MPARILAAVALVATGLALGATHGGGSARAAAAADATTPPAQAAAVETDGATPAAGEEPRPEGRAWIVGVVVFVLAVVLVTGGRWWVRNRVGRLHR